MLQLVVTVYILIIYLNHKWSEIEHFRFVFCLCDVICDVISLSTGRLTWLVYIIGAVIGGRVSFASTDEQDAMDGELVCR